MGHRGGPYLGVASILEAQILHIVPRNSGEVFLPSQELVGGQPFNLVSWAPATRGMVETRTGEPDGLFYVPDPEFWEAGIDSFRIYHPHTLPNWQTVHVVADLRMNHLLGNPIDACQLDPGWHWSTSAPNNILSTYGNSSQCAFAFTLGTGQAIVPMGGNAAVGPGGGNTSIIIDPGAPYGGGSPSSLVQIPPEDEVVWASGQIVGGPPFSSWSW